MINAVEEFFLNGVKAGIEELWEKVPSVGVDIRLLHEDGKIESIYGQVSALENLLKTTLQGREAIQQSDASLLRLGLAHQKKGIFEHQCPTGLIRYAKTIWSPDKTTMGVIVSGRFKPPHFDQTIDVFAKKFGLTLSDCQSAIKVTERTSKVFRKNIIELVAAFLDNGMNSLLDLREREFLTTAQAQRDLSSLLNLIINDLPSLIWPTAPCSVFIWDHNLASFVLRDTTSTILRTEIGKLRYGKGDGLTGWVGKYGRPIVVKDVADTQELKRVAERYSISEIPVWSKDKIREGSVGPTMIVPVIPSSGDSHNRLAGQDPIAIIRLSPQEKHKYLDDVALGLPVIRMQTVLEQIAYLLANTIENAQMNGVFRNLAMTYGEQNIDHGLTILLDHISNVFRSFSTHIRVWDKTRELWYLLSISDSSYKETIQAMGAIKQPLIEDMREKHEPYRLSRNVQNDPEMRKRISSLSQSSPAYADYLKLIGTSLIIPLRIGDEIVGALNLHRSSDEPPFQDNQVEVLRNFVPILEKMVAAIHSMDKKKGEDAAHRNIDFKYSQKEAFQYDQLRKQILDNALAISGSDLVLIRRIDESYNTLQLWMHAPRQGFEIIGDIPLSIRKGDGCCGCAWQSGLGFLVSNAETDSDFRSEIYEKRASISAANLEFLRAIKSEMALPMRVGHETQDFLVFVNQTPGKHFGARDLVKLEAFTERSSLILAYAKLGGRSVEKKIWDTALSFTFHNLGEPLSEALGHLKKISTKVSEGNFDAFDTDVEHLLGQMKNKLEGCQSTLTRFKSFLESRNRRPLPVSVSDLIERSIEGSKARFGVDGLSIILLPSHNQPPLACIAELTQECIKELIANAIDHGGAKHIVIQATHLNESQMVEIKIKDDGNGLSTEAALMWHVQGFSTAGGESRGWGLPIVKATIVWQLGEVDVRNSVEGGAEAILRIPVWDGAI